MPRLSSSVGLGLLAAASRAPSTLAAPCALDSKGNCKAINIVCDPLPDNQINWDCVFGPDSLEEVFANDGHMTTCPTASVMEPCSRFIVEKDAERAETKVMEGPEGFPFLKGEEYIFKYSVKPVEDMLVATRFTHLGQLKGSAEREMLKGDPIYSLTANKHGLHVRFSNKDSIEDYHDGLDMPLDWDDCTGEWVHVEIITTFGKSMVVNISGAVSGRAEWPGELTPVAWIDGAEMVRMKLGLYHSTHNVADQDVQYRDVSIEGPNGIIRSSPTEVEDTTGTCSIDSATGQCAKMDTTCKALAGNIIDWECIFGQGSLVEAETRGGSMLSCATGTALEPCSRFVVPKEEERAEVLAQQGVGGFEFKKGESYVFKYSFRAADGMRVSGYSTRFGQLKGVHNGYQLSGQPMFMLAATNDGINVRFSNDPDSNTEGMDEFLSWEDATGEWVHVEIVVTFGKSMKVNFSGAVTGQAVWSSSLKPVAWHNDADTMMLKLGLYHVRIKVADGEVEYKNISIEGPTGTLRTSAVGVADHGSPEGVMYVGCVKDVGSDRLLDNEYRNSDMTPQMCSAYCEGEDFFGVQYGSECWCGSPDESEDVFRHGSATCDYPCGGDDEQTCGGYWAMSLYEYGSALPYDIPEGSRYLGCYADHRFERALSWKLTTSNDMTYQWCMDFCSGFDSKYFGLQWGRECFCGASDENYDRYGTATCDMPCAGDPSLTCGGSLALNVFLAY
ncbi:unnamed protein product [Scytosiphon promiscuus]